VYKDEGLVVLGIAGLNLDSYELVQNFREYMGLTFPVLHDDGGLVNKQFAEFGSIEWGILAPPSEMFIDEAGIIRYYDYSFDLETVEGLVEDALR